MLVVLLLRVDGVHEVYLVVVASVALLDISGCNKVHLHISGGREYLVALLAWPLWLASALVLRQTHETRRVQRLLSIDQQVLCIRSLLLVVMAYILVVGVSLRATGRNPRGSACCIDAAARLLGAVLALFVDPIGWQLINMLARLTCELA